MPSQTQIYNFLMENSEPIIRYKTQKTFLGVKTFSKATRDEIINLPVVQKWLNYRPADYPELSGADYMLLHGARIELYENSMSKLLQLGLDLGFDTFRERYERYICEVQSEFDRVKPSSGMYPYLIQYKAKVVAHALWLSDEASIPYVDELIVHVMETLKNFDTDEQKFNIYMMWPTARLVQKGIIPLDLISHVLDGIFTDKYQDNAQPWHYGIHLPGYFGFNEDGFKLTILTGTTRDRKSLLIQRLYLISLFPGVMKYAWTKGALEFLEQFQTSRGTYIFPRQFLQERSSGYWIKGYYMGLGENRRRKIAMELESTYWMLLIKKQLGVA